VAELHTPRAVGEMLGLSHHEMIRRIRRGQIEATKPDGGWNYVITDEAVEKAKNSDWYKRRKARLDAANA